MTVHNRRTRTKKSWLILFLGLILISLTVVFIKEVNAKGSESLIYTPGFYSTPVAAPNLTSLQYKINAYFKKNQVEHSYYLEDLLSHRSAGSEMNVEENAASLFKTPYVMAIYKQAELGNVDLDKPVTIKQSWINKDYGDLWREGAGAKITLREASRRALTQSDNTAIKIVSAYLQNINMDDSPMAAVSSWPTVHDGNLYISSKSYAPYLHCLFYSCYLSQNDSKQILQMMTESHFWGIPQGVPTRIIVAHKIGETSSVHSDCGIVYYPKRPYLLCVMLKADRTTYRRIIEDISRITYQQFEKALKP